MLELWGMQSTPSLPLLPGPLWPRVVTLDSVQSMGQIEGGFKYHFLSHWYDLI